MKETISVIVPIYNGERYLDCCIQSIVGQTYTNLEIILVNDGSQDGSAAICDAWAAKDPRIKVIHKPNRGVSDSRNVGIQNATGNWVTFVDADDVVSAYLVESMISEQLREDTLYLTAHALFVDDPPKDNDGYTYQVREDNSFISVRSSYYCVGALYNRGVIRKANLAFDPGLQRMEDEGFLIIYLLYIRRICFVSEPMYYYRQNPYSETGGPTDYKKQAHAWKKVQNSVLRWFCEYDLEDKYRNENREYYRHCQNKMINECVKGKLHYANYKEIDVAHSDVVSQAIQQMFPAEYYFSQYLPRLYYICYTFLMKLRNKLADIWRRK